MNSPPLKHKRTLSGFLSKKWNKAFQGSSSTPVSPKTSRPPSIQLTSSPTSSLNQSIPSDCTDSALAVSQQAIISPQASLQISQSLPAFCASTSATECSGNEPPSALLSDEGSDPLIENKNPVDLIRPIDPALQTGQQPTSGVWAGLGMALRALHKNVGQFPPLQSAIVTFTDCLDILEEGAKNRQDYEELATELIALAKLLTQHMKQSNSARMSDSVANVARSIEAQAKLIKNKRDRGTARGVIEANSDLEELEQHYRRIGALFRQLQADANLSIWNIVNDHMANTRLEGLMPVKLANYDSKLSEGISRRTCTPNTRTVILSKLNDWSSNPEAPDLYWMNGMAGTGKTTIACSFSESLEERKQLAASFFCTRTVPECMEATRIIPTIAYQLARYSVPFQSALSETLDRDPDVGVKNMTKQFEQLLKTPLLKVKEAIPNNLVVVIDALDECSDMREVELLLSILFKSVNQLPLKFFMTSRPEPEIYRRMLARGQGVGDVLHLHDVEKSLVQADIEIYLSEELDFMSPAPRQIKELAERSGNLFIYAATLVRYIRPGKGSRDPQKRLNSALAITSQPNKLHAEIDELYTAVLQAAISAEGLEDEEVDDMRTVLWTVVCIQEPVAIDTLAAMSGLHGAQRVLTALDALRSVIHFSESTGLVSTLHASFPDFMFDETRSGSLGCNLNKCSERLTWRCFKLMETQLRFNICKLESSFVPDSEVYNLEERVNQVISPPLWYACCYWGDHLRHSTYSDALCTTLSNFLSVRLLFWMEALNLKRKMHMGMRVLLKAKLWLQINAASVDVARLAEDSRNFVTSFAANPVSQCTPHIYISLLPFCSKSSSVLKQYWKNMRRTINVTGTAMRRREVAPLASWNTQSSVHSAAYSPDGNHIAVGCYDGTVSVRSAYDGTLVAGPFRGHTSLVPSVSYSPDGTCIVSGSADNTIRVWNAHDGTLLASPFRGHTDRVWSVRYSPDGSQIVSGSMDKTIRVCSAHDGTLIIGPLQGHMGPIRSVEYSPDGLRIVSGSEDKTIRVWSAYDGTLIAAPLRGHTGPVWSVGYSPDGSRIVSGSADKTIRVWSAHDGTPIGDPLQGHTQTVRSVNYSPDGSRIVSSSVDKTIRVWSAHNGTLLAGPLQGHTQTVRSVGYSPDGSRIVSSSVDKTIRVWSAHADILLAGPLQDSNGVSSVGYSPDGSRIVSGSADSTIRVWNAHKGTLLISIRGHTSVVSSVGYSPDGSRIVSGSVDKTVRVWSAHDGTLLTGPLRGHTQAVLSVAYSPNGLHIVSGSEDKTIRVWSERDNTLIAGPLQGHEGPVRSVGYSPDSLRIVSGSDDKTIRVWSARDGTLIAGPLRGHIGLVRSVGYSPDGSRIVSGSEDKTIRVWSAHDGTLIAEPLLGHSHAVLTVGYSPDGSHIVSGSADKTIRVWSARDGILIFGPFQGHTDAVWSARWSPDGHRIVSGSVDTTIRVWSVHDRARVTSPFQGLTVSVPNPPTRYRTHKPHTTFTNWAVRHDGWVINNRSQLLFWVPFELASYLRTTHAHELLVIYPHTLFQIDHDDVLLGEHWHRCYILE